MPENHETRAEFERLVEQNDFSMATIVELQMAVRTIGGGDHVGDVENQSTRDQFVHTLTKVSLGWCIGGRVADMARQLLSNPKELVDFKNAVLDYVNGYLFQIQDELKELAGGDK